MLQIWVTWQQPHACILWVLRVKLCNCIIRYDKLLYSLVALHPQTVIMLLSVLCNQLGTVKNNPMSLLNCLTCSTAGVKLLLVDVNVVLNDENDGNKLYVVVLNRVILGIASWFGCLMLA